MAKDILENIQKIIGDGVQHKDTITRAKVVSVDEDNCTVDVALDSGVEIYDIRLRAVTDTDSGMVLFPREGSYILFTTVEGQQDLVMVQASELDKVSIKIGEAELIMDESGYEIKKEGVSLKSVFEKLEDLLTNFKVNTPAGPSVGLVPDTTAKLELFTNEFNQLLNA